MDSYVNSTRENCRLNAPKKPRSAILRGRRKMAARAGLSVSELMPDRTTEMAMVMANWLYNWPVTPGMSDAGTKTAASESVVATIGPATSFIAALAARYGSVSPASNLRSTFSTTTMASSTTMPMESTKPSNVSVLIENPSPSMIANVPMIDTGMAIIGMIVVRKLCRNT